MEFQVNMKCGADSFSIIESAIQSVDASAQLDFDPLETTLRVAAALSPAQLVEIISESGHPVTIEQVRQLPSTCCGSCSG